MSSCEGDEGETWCRVTSQRPSRREPGAGSPNGRSDLCVTSRAPGSAQRSGPPRGFLGGGGDRPYAVAFLTDLLLAGYVRGSGSGQRGGQVCGPELAGRRRGCRVRPGGPAGFSLFQTKTQDPRQRGPLGQHRDPGEHHVSRAAAACGGPARFFEYFAVVFRSVT